MSDLDTPSDDTDESAPVFRATHETAEDDSETLADSGYPGYPGFIGHDSPPDFTEHDHMETDPQPGTSLKPRHRELARLHALGKTNNQICATLGYSVSRVSILLSTAAIQAEVDRYRNRLYEQDLISAMKELGGDARRVIEDMLRSPAERLRDKAEIAKWLIEKLTGKPKQEVAVESHTLAAFMESLKQLSDRGETLDITPTLTTSSAASPSAERGTPGAPQISDAPSQPSFTAWLDKNL